MTRRGIRSLLWSALSDLFDQRTPFGRLAAVHCVSTAGDTFITVALAGSLFFSVSPTEATSKVLLYLLLTVAPFAVVSPLLGPLIDRSAGGRRYLIATSSLVRTGLCVVMATHSHDWLLFPAAFLSLVGSKLYAVTRGALIPEMLREHQLSQRASSVNGAGWPADGSDEADGFAGFNAQLTLLGTVAGFVAGSLAVGLLRALDASVVLVVAAATFGLAGILSLRLSRGVAVIRELTRADGRYGDRDVLWGLNAMAMLRFAMGFAAFLIAFGLRRAHAPVSLFALAMSSVGVGSMAGLALITRLRRRVNEPTVIVLSLAVMALIATAGYVGASTGVQIAVTAGLAATAAMAQPAFDAITQSAVSPLAQGETFARFAVRQQLLWVLGAVIPVAIHLSYRSGDELLAATTGVGALWYLVGRHPRRAST
jgi:MFS family permease